MSAGTTVVAIGESAHFVGEFNQLRADLVADLVRHHGVTRLALEVGHDEAPAIQSWWRDPRPDVRCPVGPLTTRLYGTFLTELRSRLGDYTAPAVLAVDLPNSLTLAPTLGPLADLVAELDPAAAELVARARFLAEPLCGASAAASAAAWSELDPVVGDELIALLARVSARLDSLDGSGFATDGSGAAELGRTALTSALMLRAMAELFAGAGLPADTTLRERFVAQRLLDAVADLPDGERIAYVAHNNHIQKAPVVFGGEVAAYPAGLFLARTLGAAYTSIALSHLDDEVPEMIVPATTPLGFRVERVAADPLTDSSVEAAADGRQEPVIVRPANAGCTIRSQSAAASVPADAFDAVVVVPTATTDPAVAGP